MFMNTMAVPFFEPMFCVTGATDALFLFHCTLYARRVGVVVTVDVARLAAQVKGVRRAIVKEGKETSVERVYEKITCGQTAALNNIAR